MTQPVMLVTGATGSIGGAIVENALSAGWAVAVHGRSQTSLDARLAHLRSRQGADDATCGIVADIASESEIERLVEAAGAWRGRLDAVIDCVSAGPQKRLSGDFAETDTSGYAAMMELSAVYVQRLAHAALPWLKREGGAFIAFASDAGRFAAPRQALIGASRAAIIGFVRNLAVEVAGDGVRIHCISPSFVDGTTVAARLAGHDAMRLERARSKAGLGLPTPSDIAPLAIFLCGDGARRITGQVISINGGVNA